MARDPFDFQVVRLPEGTAHALNGRDFPGPVLEFPSEIERRIDQYLARQAALTTDELDQGPIAGSLAAH
jgi:hypothetical protein